MRLGLLGCLAGVVSLAVAAPGVAGAAADMTVKKSVSKNPAQVGDRLTYEVLVTNLGPDRATGVVGADRLPPEVRFESATVSQGGPCFVTSLVQCPIGEMGSGDTQTMTIVVTLVEEPFEGIFITNFASVFSDNDPDDSNNHTEHKTTVEDGRGDDEEPCIPERAFTEVDIMENFLRKTIERVKKGKLSGKKLSKRTKQLDKMKLAMLREHFPTVFGVKFVSLFRQLEEFDSRMQLIRTLIVIDAVGVDKDTARKLKKAQKELKDLEAVLGQGRGVPERALTDLDVMENFLRKTLERVEKGELGGEKLSKRTKQLDKMKLDLAREHFPTVCGVKFISLFRQLEEFDSRMQLIRTLIVIDAVGVGKDTARQLKKAQKELKDLERVLGQTTNGRDD